jgi:hypothetical protein
MPRFLLCWLLFAAGYLLLAGQLTLDETMLALSFGLISALFSRALSRLGSLHFRFNPQAISAIGRALAELPTATGRVAVIFISAVIKGRTGRMETQRFAIGRSHGSVAMGRRAVALLSASLSPDQFVLQTSEVDHSVMMHSLSESNCAPNSRWLV